MKRLGKTITAIAVAGASLAAGYTLYSLGMRHGMDMGQVSTPGAASNGASAAQGLPQSIAQGEEATRRHIATGLKAGDTDPATGRTILHYHDPMVPGNRFDKPAKSPFMDMMLVPVYAGGDSDTGTVTVSPRVQQSLGVRTAEVLMGTLAPEVSVVGSIAFNERDQAVLQARTAGFVERVHVRATLDRVQAGQPLAELYLPTWVAAQEEFLALRNMRGDDLATLVDGARQRMRQVGMTDTQIALVERTGRTHPRTTLVAPLSGVVVELLVRDGMAVQPGATLFRINGLSPVWANAELPESQAALVRPGARVEASTPAVPGTTFTGRVQALLPSVDPSTRTLKARVELANPGARLVPGMFVQMRFTQPRGKTSLLVPTEAVIQTGQRTVVVLAETNGSFRPVTVDAGVESGGQTEIRRGLQAGQRVVVSSQFLIDSEASLKGLEARLNAEALPAAVQHSGTATVVAVDGQSALLAHGPLTSAGMGAMTMEFKAPAGGMPRNIRKGDRVQFEFILPQDAEPTLTSITLTTPAGRPAAAGTGTTP